MTKIDLIISSAVGALALLLTVEYAFPAVAGMFSNVFKLINGGAL